MTTLITLLISLLGYGTPADYADYSEEQLQHEITLAEEAQAQEEEDGGQGTSWDMPGVVDPDPQP